MIISFTNSVVLKYHNNVCVYTYIYSTFHVRTSKCINYNTKITTGGRGLQIFRLLVAQRERKTSWDQSHVNSAKAEDWWLVFYH